MAEKKGAGPAWSVVSGDDFGATVKIFDNDLRRELYEADVLDAILYWDEDDEISAERKKRIEKAAQSLKLVRFMETFADEDFARRLPQIVEEGSEELGKFVAGVQAEIEKARAGCEAARSGEGVPFEWLPFAFRAGEKVAVDLEECSHGAQLVSVSVEHTFFGAWTVFVYKFLSHDGKKLAWASASKRVADYSGRKGESALGVRSLRGAEEAEFAECGRKWLELVAAPAYSAYEGSMTRRSWWVSNRFRASGRIMVDMAGMRSMDPNYRMFYGESDGEDEGEGGKTTGLEGAEALATPFVYGFSFAAKAWGEFLVDSVGKIEFRSDAFDKLVLEKDRKKLISALVSHSAPGFADLIDGKGGGCVFLLHGPPGCGKTLTAEAIAEKLGRPLYMVGAGELGVSPDELEKRLKNILDLSHSWNAVLLIDECDIFLERRSSSDISRNAMVGIFLRLLEYYQGILFLTTNRVGDLDEAFLSRVSVGLHYKALDEKARESVWANLAASAGMELSAEEVRELAERKVNGRQIKHALRLALSLAAEEGRPARFEDVASVIAISEQFKKDFSAAKDASAARPDALEG